MESRIKAVVFDLGRVVVDFDHLRAARRLSAFTDKSAQQIYDLFFDSKLTRRFEEGVIPPEKFFREVKKTLGMDMEFSAFVPVWNEIFYFTPENKKVYELAKLLKERYTVAILSNINKLHFDYLKENFSFFDAFHRIFTSYELGAVKPDPLIYKKVFDLLGFAPPQIFYVDDRPELIEQAGLLGARAFVFKGIEKLRSDLKCEGISPD